MHRNNTTHEAASCLNFAAQHAELSADLNALFQAYDASMLPVLPEDLSVAVAVRASEFDWKVGFYKTNVSQLLVLLRSANTDNEWDESLASHFGCPVNKLYEVGLNLFFFPLAHAVRALKHMRKTEFNKLIAKYHFPIEQLTEQQQQFLCLQLKRNFSAFLSNAEAYTRRGPRLFKQKDKLDITWKNFFQPNILGKRKLGI